MTNTISTKLALAADHDRKADQLGETEEAAWYRMSAQSLRWEAEALMAAELTAALAA
jgi:hypothetical protein